MTEKEEMLARASNREFVEHNRRIMHLFQMLQREYKALTTMYAATENYMDEDEFLESMDFLVESGYIKLRTVRDKSPVEELADSRWELLEGRFTEKGKRLMRCDIHDNLVVV